MEMQNGVLEEERGGRIEVENLIWAIFPEYLNY